MRFRLVLITAFSVVLVTCQDHRQDRPVEPLDFLGCYADLHTADVNNDGFVKQNEYLGFIQEYGKQRCFRTSRLTFLQSATFNRLACLCRQQENSREDCCIGDNARILTEGALLPPDIQTPAHRSYLTTVCKLTDATIDGYCAPSSSPSSMPSIIPSASPSTSIEPTSVPSISMAPTKEIMLVSAQEADSSASSQNSGTSRQKIVFSCASVLFLSLLS